MDSVIENQHANTQAVSKSQELMKRALKVIPGGVNSPVRAFGSVGGTPVFFEKGEGAYVYDQDGNRYIDYVGSWGPLILGHAHPEILQTLQSKAALGLSFGAPTQIEVEMAERITNLIPSMEQVRMVSSGTEATMSAIRLARGYTKRQKILKFEGCYHGHVDSLLVKAGSGALTFGVPTSNGVPEAFADLTATLPYNDIDALKEFFQTHGDALACVIVEPVVGNMNLIPPADGFLETLRSLCTEYGSVLIFDEVMTGFRVHPGGAQGRFDIQPDMTCLGKVIGGGMPVGAFGGRKNIMAQLAPLGGVYQAGTLSGNPLAMAVGLKTLELIHQPGGYEALFSITQSLVDVFNNLAKKHAIGLYARNCGSMFGFFFTDAKQAPMNFAEVSACDLDRFNQFYHLALAQGLYFAPSAFEAGFVSMCHDQSVILETEKGLDAVFEQMAASQL